MKKGTMTRDAAVAMVGEKAVTKAEAANCEPTNRVGYNGACHGDEATEWSASAQSDRGTVTVYYYTTNEQDAVMADNDGDGSYIDWTIAGYEVTE